MRQGTISKSSLMILREIKDNPGITQTEVSTNLDLSFTAVSRHFRESYGYEFLNNLVEKRRNSDDDADGREKALYIKEGLEDEVDVLLDALEIVEKYRSD